MSPEQVPVDPHSLTIYDDSIAMLQAFRTCEQRLIVDVQGCYESLQYSPAINT